MRKLKETVADVPELMKEWDSDVNSSLGIYPDRIGSQSNTYAYWKCEYGHKWKAKINNRYNGRGCPECSKGKKTSFPEQAVLFYVRQVFPNAINSYKDIFNGGMELDVYIPSEKIGIEYDGANWHNLSTRKKEKTKYTICKKEEVYLFRLREDFEGYGHLEPICDRLIPVRRQYRGTPQDYIALDYAIRQLLVELNDIDCSKFEDYQYAMIFSQPKTDVNTKRDQRLIYESYLVERDKNSFGALFPEIAQKWHPTKNGKLTPFLFTPHSKYEAWWLGECGHEWQNSITVMTRGYGCPYCSGQRVLKGFNDLATVYPEIAAQWHPTKNGKYTPDMFTFGSGHKAYWLCQTCGQEWQTRINMRTISKRDCPYCAHEKPIKGVNDLPTLRPDLMQEWDYEKNAGIDPSDLMPNSNKKVWWKCSKCGYNYHTLVCGRNRGTGCKKCAGQVLVPGVNDLETLYPQIAAEWDYDENNGILPSMVFPNDNKPYHWKCKLGHKWVVSANNRMRTNCPFCSGNKVLEGFNDIATTHPEIAAQWHPTKNGDILPTKVSKGYTKKVWFICDKCGHSYETFIGNKIKGYGECPFCSTRKTRASSIYLVEKGLYFDTLKEAAAYMGKKSIANIQVCCSGKTQTAYGYHWEYREKTEE